VAQPSIKRGVDRNRFAWTIEVCAVAQIAYRSAAAPRSCETLGNGGLDAVPVQSLQSMQEREDNFIILNSGFDSEKNMQTLPL
jgi:hypothetical protein